MTSSPSQQQQTFKNYFRRYLFGQANSYQILNSFNSIPNINQKLKKNKLLNQRKHPNLTHKEQVKINAQKYTQVFRLAQQSNNPELIFRDADWMTQIYGFVLNTNAFLVTIQLLGKEEQVRMWRKLVLKGQVIGGYGQTELGHGSNVQKLQTEALYNQEKDTFILNTPKVTAVKFWPGCFGIFSTHCVIQAKTTIKGQNIGIQTFILPMRDIYLNELPGIQSGDIGPKIGFLTVDNGYLKINNVQIPRQNMLMKYIQVQSNGTVKGLQNKQAIKYGYGSMLNLRVKLVVGFALGYTYNPASFQYLLLQSKNKLQSQPMVKKFLIERMCTGVGTTLSNIYVVRIFRDFLTSLKQHNYDQADKLLASCHIMSSTFKALSSWKSEETLRLCSTLNQYGTFQSIFIPKFFTDCIPSVTYQGDNNVLLQQTAKFILMKEKDTQLSKPQSSIDGNNLTQILKVLKYMASSQIRHLKNLIEKAIGEGNDFKVVWNQIYQEKIIQVSKIWGRMMLLKTALHTLDKVPQYREFFKKIVQVFASTLLEQTPQTVFYGFDLAKAPTAWKQFTETQLNVLKDLNRPLPKQFQQFKYETRGNDSVKDWIESKL